VASCRACAKLLDDVIALDRAIERTTLVPTPDGLVDRVLLTPRPRGTWRYAAAASVALATVLLGLFGAGVVHAPEYARTAEAVGPSHPAVTAIAEVVDEGLSGPYAARFDLNEIKRSLKPLGLAIKPGEAIAYYVGACRIAGAGTCEHIVLSTPDAQANVMLMPDYPVGERILVSDRRMTALVNPVAHGGYIVVADSAAIARRMEKLLIKG
jgi:hypothetical protein